MSKHTPGPWQDDAEFPEHLIVPEYGRIWINGYDSEGAPIHIGYVDGPRTVERIANARLIAAAPDLLEALKDMLSGWRYLRAVYGDLSGVGWDRAENAAIAAIAKAEGGSDETT